MKLSFLDKASIGHALICFMNLAIWVPFGLPVVEPPGSGGFGATLLTLYASVILSLIACIALTYQLALATVAAVKKSPVPRCTVALLSNCLAITMSLGVVYVLSTS